jgi:hypothetical protein
MGHRFGALLLAGVGVGLITVWAALTVAGVDDAVDLSALPALAAGLVFVLLAAYFDESSIQIRTLGLDVQLGPPKPIPPARLEDEVAELEAYRGTGSQTANTPSASAAPRS